MKSLINSVAMAFSMFSAVPLPMTEWKKENMKFMLCALPLVGVLIAAVLLLWHWLCEVLDMGVFMYAAGLTLIPLAVSRVRAPFPLFSPRHTSSPPSPSARSLSGICAPCFLSGSAM